MWCILGKSSAGKLTGPVETAGCTVWKGLWHTSEASECTVLPVDYTVVSAVTWPGPLLKSPWARDQLFSICKSICFLTGPDLWPSCRRDSVMNFSLSKPSTRSSGNPCDAVVICGIQCAAYAAGRQRVILSQNPADNTDQDLPVLLPQQTVNKRVTGGLGVGQTFGGDAQIPGDVHRGQQLQHSARNPRRRC